LKRYLIITSRVRIYLKGGDLRTDKDNLDQYKTHFFYKSRMVR